MEINGQVNQQCEQRQSQTDQTQTVGGRKRVGPTSTGRRFSAVRRASRSVRSLNSHVGPKIAFEWQMLSNAGWIEQSVNRSTDAAAKQVTVAPNPTEVVVLVWTMTQVSALVLRKSDESGWPGQFSWSQRFVSCDGVRVGDFSLLVPGVSGQSTYFVLHRFIHLDQRARRLGLW